MLENKKIGYRLYIYCDVCHCYHPFGMGHKKVNIKNEVATRRAISPNVGGMS